MRTLRKFLSLFPAPFWAAFAAGCLLRVWVGLHNPDVLLLGPSDYTMMARNLIEHGTIGYGGTVPSAFRLPGYSLLIAALFSITGDSQDLVQVLILNLALMSAIVLLTYRLAIRLVTERQALVATWMLALNPALVPLNLDMGIETTFMLLLTIMAWSLVRLVEDPENGRRWALTGAAIGVSMTVRSTFLIFPVLLGAVAFLIFPRRPTLTRLLLLMGCAYIFVAPWTVRNWNHFGRIVPFEDGMGWHTLWQGSVSVEGIQPDENLPEPMRTYYFTHDPKIGTYSRKLALENIRRSPGRYILNCIGRLRNIWFSAGWAEVLFNASDSFNAYRQRGQWRLAGTKAAFKLLELAFLAIMLWGIFMNLQSPPLALLALMLLYMNIHILTMGLPRYTMPIFPLMALFCTLGLSDVRERLRRKR